MTRQTRLRYITDEEVRGALTMPEAILAVKEAFIQLSMGQAKVPGRASDLHFIGGTMIGGTSRVLDFHSTLL